MNNKTKVALITGAGQGIGRAIALRLAKDGVDIAIVDLKKDKMDAVAKEVQALGRKATVFVADVTVAEEYHSSQAPGWCGKIDRRPNPAQHFRSPRSAEFGDICDRLLSIFCCIR